MYNSFHVNHTFGIFKNNIYDLERLAKRVVGMMWGGTGGRETGRKGGGRYTGGGRRGGGKRDSQGSGKREKKGKIMQHCAIFRNRINAKGREPKNTGREPGLKGTGSGRFKPPCPPPPTMIKTRYNTDVTLQLFFLSLKPVNWIF